MKLIKIYNAIMASKRHKDLNVTLPSGHRGMGLKEQ